MKKVTAFLVQIQYNRSMKLLKPLISSALTIAVLAWAIPTVSYQNITTLILASFVLTLLQKIAKPVLKILFLPINVVTLGLFSLVINVFILWLATYLVPGFRIENMVFFGVYLNQFFSLLLISFFIGFLQGILGFVL